MTSRACCFKYAQQLNLQQWVIVGNGLEVEVRLAGLSSEYPVNVVAELYEAVLGAIYVDAGLARSHDWFANHIKWPKKLPTAIERFVNGNVVNE